MTTNFYESLNELVTDARFRGLAVTQNFETFLAGPGMNEAENMFTLSWFLNPRGSHGLSDMFLKEFCTTAWTMIHGQYGQHFKGFKGLKFFSGLSPVTFQNCSFMNAFVDREICKEVPGADLVITDVASRVMIVVNNQYSSGTCDKAHTYFAGEKFGHFDHKIFISFDGEVCGIKDSKWMYMSNEWLINLCTHLIDCPQYNNAKTTGYLKDFYQFLTGTQYGISHEEIADGAASLVSEYYEVISQLKTFKAEKISNVPLVGINPRDYASAYLGKISEKEYGVLSLYWSYKNTFNTFFQIAELETVTRNLEKNTESKPYRFDRKFVRNGLCFTPAFDKVKADRSFMNTIFDVEMVYDAKKNLNLGLVINKGSWDRLTQGQRDTLQKNFDFQTVILKDRVVVWNSFYKQDWMSKDLGKEIVTVFEKIDMYLGHIGIRAA